MFKKNDTVFYDHSGICQIVDITTKKIMNVERDYYVLQPVNDSKSLIYVPIDNETLVSQMKKTLNRQEVENIITQLKDQPDIWVEDRNQRKELFNTILHGGDCLKITTMLKSIYHHRISLQAKKKKLPAADEGIYREAEKMLVDSFSHILNIPSNQVIPYIVSQIESN